MAYQVDKFNGTFLVSVDDGTIDTTTDLRFVGKNYAGYGEVQNENFLHLLENFANTSQPPKPVAGQVWYDSGNKKIKFFDGSDFRTASGAEIGSESPSLQQQTGDFWFDTSSDQLKAWNGTEYILIGPETAPDLGASAVISLVVKDNVSPAPNNHTIVKFNSGGDTIAIISKDAFTLNSIQNPITGFDVIKKGVTLVNTNGTTGVTTTDHFFWGTASNTAKLGGYPASDYIRTGEIAFTQEISFSDAGFTIGDQNDIRFRIENGDEPVIENRLGNTITMRVRVTDSDLRNVAIFTPTAIVPGSNNFFNIGSSTSRYANIYATTFLGAFTGNVTGNVVGTTKGNVLAEDLSIAFNATTKTFAGAFAGTLTGNVIGSVTGTASNALTLNSLVGELGAVNGSIAVRDSLANITANRFIGVVDKADRIKIDNTAVDTDPVYKSAKTTATSNTIAARDGSGNLTANLFQGTATAAQYADLAEKYLADKQYDVGTVVCIGGENEVTAASYGDRAIGVVSTNPAFMMNKDLEGGTYIALKGRVPVKVQGTIKKGDKLVPAQNMFGSASAANESDTDYFAIALQDHQSGPGVIEALVL
jgi:hypothetical protein